MALSLVPISNISEDFGKIEYQLQIQLNAPHLQISECYDLSNPIVSAQFMTYSKQFQPSNVVDVFVCTSDLKQLLSDIYSKGIKVDSKRGFRFRVGSFEVDRSKEVIEVVRLSIALGNPLNYQPSNSTDYEESVFLDENPSSSNLRSGYQSLCVSSEGDYIIFNSSQVKTCNLIRFRGGDNLTEVTDDGDMCESCGKNPASIWCINCGAKLCDSCDSQTHSGNKILNRHRRMPISEARAQMEFCPYHEGIHVEYYCPQCQAPVCFECKMTGSHSKGDAATHPLIPIKQAYNEALEAQRSEDPILTRRKAAITAKLADADDRIKAIQANADNVEEEIMRIATSAIEHAKSYAGEKALLVRSVKTELERKLNEISNLEHFIDAHKKTAGPLSFIRAFDRHSMLIGEMQGTSDLPGDVTVQADLSVSGSIDVESSNIQPIISPKKHTPKHQFSYGDNQRNERPKQIDEEEDQGSFEEPPQNSRIEEKSQVKPRSSMGTPNITSLLAIAQKKEQKNKAKKMVLNFKPFEESAILTDDSQCCALYLCFPFKAQPQTHLLFSTKRDGRSIAQMHQLIDGIGITAVLIKHGDYVFGGFAAAKWNSSGKPFGDNSSSFLFSISQLSFIPYIGRKPDSCHLIATPDTLSFGKYDIILADDFDNCTAVLENSYGVGFQPESTEAETYLAGTPHFRADIVEVWGFFTIEQQ